MATEAMRVGDYEILNRLGVGGMGQVYRVRNVISDRIEAMKILLPSLSDHPEVGERFLREIKLVASLHHPNIANLCTATAINNQLVMVMEYIDGRSFSELLSQGPIATADALRYFDQALSALEYAHARGIVHRDLKPSNIMLTHAGVVKLMDFGIARSAAEEGLTQTGATLGTVSYMSPEQIAGTALDGRSDLYSMGIFFFETLTGQRPFRGDSDYELMVAHMQTTPRFPVELAPGLPPGVSEIVMKLLAKAPGERFQTAGEVRAALAALMPTAPVEVGAPGERPRISFSASPLPPAASTARRQGRHLALYLSGGLLCALVVAAMLVFAPWRASETKRSPASIGLLPVRASASATQAPDSSVDEAATADTGPDLSAAANQPSPATLSRPAASAHGRTGAAKAAPGTPAPTGTPVAPILPLVADAPPSPSPAPSPAVQQQLEQEEMHLDQLSARAAAVNNSLEAMQRNMAQSGVALRGDMAGTQASMNLNLTKAKQALATNDPERATRFASLAERDLGHLESFLGR